MKVNKRILESLNESEDILESNLQVFNNVLADWDFIGEVTEPYISDVSVMGDEVSITCELWDPDVDDYVSVNGGTYNCPQFVNLMREVDLNKTDDLYGDCRNLVDILYAVSKENWDEKVKELSSKVEEELKNLNESAKSEEELRKELKDFIIETYGKGTKLIDNVNGFVAFNDIIKSIVSSYLEEGYDGTLEDYLDSLEYPQGLIEIQPTDPKWYCIECGKKKQDYEAMYCDECWEKEKKKSGLKEAAENYTDDELWEMLVNSEKFIKYVEQERGLKNLTPQSGEVRDRADEWLEGNYDGVIDFLGLDESVEIKTGFSDPQTKDILDAVIGQLSDGMWEENPRMEKFWNNMDVDANGNIKVNNDAYDSGFYGKNETEIKKWIATKIKQIVKEEGLEWSRDNTENCSYLDYGSGVTVQDAYRVYDRLLGRKDYIIKESTEERFHSFDELKDRDDWTTAVAVFTEDSFDKPYSLEERSYAFSRNNRYFEEGKIAKSIFANCLDGKDLGVRLDWYCPGQWKIDYIYILK